jgi:ankyrin repeat protein
MSSTCNALSQDWMRMLLEHGANFNVKDNRGKTPLHQVLVFEHYSDEDRFSSHIAQLLIEHGADVSAQDVHDETP